MSNEIITCFNEKECSYKECALFSEELDACKLELLKGSPAPVAPKKTEPTQAGDADLSAALHEYASELDFSQIPEIVTPKKFMQDNWIKVMDILKPLGYGWVKDGRNSRWEYGKQSPRERDLTGITKSTVEVDTSGIEWNVKDGDNTVQARTGEKAWAFVMGYDTEAKKSTDTPKQSTQALHDYLQQEEHYCDGVYAYFMNKDASFFSRDPLV